jgi:signal transduction histidine kinase
MSSLAAQAARTWAATVYLATGIAVGTVAIVVLAVGLSVGIGLSVIGIGVPILAATMAGWRLLAGAERRRASLVLGDPVPEAYAPAPAGGAWTRWRARLADRATWRDLGWCALLGPVGIAGGALAVALWACVLVLLTAPVTVPFLDEDSVLGGLGAGVEWALGAAGIAGVAAVGVFVRALAEVTVRMASWLLAPDERALLAARVVSLEETRAGVVESADGVLRRIERDLHDGAQHRLAYVAMTLGRAQAKLDDGDAAGAQELLRGASDESKRAMAELRDLVRGIHPSVLTDRGLDAAISSLAGRSTVPVAVKVAVPRRPPPAIETAAYFVVAEALTNVGRHSEATHAEVDVELVGRLLRVIVRDDGRGGASRDAGSGLEGLGRRVEALDGTLTVDSPPGGPTWIEAVLPCGS